MALALLFSQKLSAAFKFIMHIAPIAVLLAAHSFAEQFFDKHPRKLAGIAKAKQGDAETAGFYFVSRR